MSDPTPITTQIVEGAEAHLEMDEAELRIIAGPDRGVIVPLSNESLIIGTSSACEIVLHDGSVSSRHAEIVSTPKGFVIRDLDSTNGIWIETVPVERARLIDGLKIQLGSTVLTVRAKGTRRAIPLDQPGQLGELVAHSVKMRAVAAALKQLAVADIAVLIEGETGTGKEVAAQSIHAASHRARGPFVVFDCGAVAPQLAAAELFGHVAGAFTGAESERPGLLEDADGGTLFLDEIGELPLEVQPLLLGALERKSSRRLGGRNQVEHDVRIIAATHRNLSEQVRRGKFREDLYFRLAVGKCRLPSLRERPEDIPILADKFAAEVGAPLTPTVRALLATHDWPGNVRELRNTVMRMAAQPEAPLLSERIIAREGTAPKLTDPEGRIYALADLRRNADENLERDYLKELLRHAKGDLRKATELSGITRQHLGRMLTKYGLYERG